MSENFKFNPWNTASLDDFLFYCCPQCDSRASSKSDFIQHAVNNHPESQTFINAFEQNNNPRAFVSLTERKIDKQLSHFLINEIQLKKTVLSLPKLSEATLAKYTSKSESLIDISEEKIKNSNVVTLCYTSDDSSDSDSDNEEIAASDKNEDVEIVESSCGANQKADSSRPEAKVTETPFVKIRYEKGKVVLKKKGKGDLAFDSFQEATDFAEREALRSHHTTKSPATNQIGTVDLTMSNDKQSSATEEPMNEDGTDFDSTGIDMIDKLTPEVQIEELSCDTRKNVWKCDFCHMSFMNQTIYDQHMNLVHNVL